VARYPDMKELGRFSAEDYSSITSLEQINRQPKSRFERGYPGQGSPEWWALREKYEAILVAKVRRERAESRMKFLHNDAEELAAKWAAMGNETADKDYQDFVRVLGPNAAPRKKDWLDATANALKRIPQ
jgi:hypothetical protein